MITPLLSVITITYNQEQYIEQTLKSILSQKTDFNFEVLVYDDASSDGTPEIIRKYEEKYPDIIKAKLRHENVGAIENCTSALKAATGEYIALCEGDDYWIDERKLQRQVDFMKSHPKHSLCFHKTRVVFENGEEETVEYPFRTTGFSQVALINENFIQTNSVVYKRVDYSSLSDKPFPFDWYLHLFHAKYGPIGFLDGVMSVYRRHQGGMWWLAYKDFDQVWIKYGMNYLYLLEEVNKMYGENHRCLKAVEEKVFETFSQFIEADKRKKSDILYRASDLFPRFATISLQLFSKKIEKSKTEIENLFEQLEKVKVEEERLKNDAQKERQDLLDLHSELASRIGLIENSRIWRIRNTILKIVGHR